VDEKLRSSAPPELTASLHELFQRATSALRGRERRWMEALIPKFKRPAGNEKLPASAGGSK